MSCSAAAAETPPPQWQPSEGGGRRKRPSHKGIDFNTMTKKQLRHKLMQKGGIMAKLHALAAEMRVRGHDSLRKPQLVERMVNKATSNNGFLERLKRMSVL